MAKTVKEVFKEKVKERLDAHPNQWTGEDSAEVVRAVVEAVGDGKGKPITLTEAQKDVIQLASRPTNEVQMRVIKRIIEEHGGTADTDAESLIRQVVSPTGFKMELTKAGVIKNTGSSALKDILA